MNTLISIELHIVHIWLACLDLPILQLNQHAKSLNWDEIERANQFKVITSKQHFIAARAILRLTLSQYLGQAPESLVFAYTEFHKPILKEDTHKTNISFNVTHSHGLAIYAVAREHPVGIDMEKVKPLPYLQLAKRFFNIAEYDYLIGLPEAEQLAGFYRLWTRKETVLKTAGMGLNLPIHHCSVADEAVQPLNLDNKNWLWDKQDLMAYFSIL